MLKIRNVLVALLIDFAFTACFESKTENAVEDAGENIEESAENAGDAMEDAADDAEDAIEPDFKY